MTRPTWDEYFMAMAVVVSSRASCHHVRAGSVIVLDNRIIGTGYNGVPPGIKQNCLEAGCYKESVGEEYGKSFGSGKCIGVHAEMNALANLSRGIHQGATIYTTIFPCPSCAKNLLAYNIKRVVYMREYDEQETSLSMMFFDEAGVKVDKVEVTKEKMNDIVQGMDGKKFGVFK